MTEILFWLHIFKIIYITVTSDDKFIHEKDFEV